MGSRSYYSIDEIKRAASEAEINKFTIDKLIAVLKDLDQQDEDDDDINYEAGMGY